uniref:Uncharacterized protein n=1 Tax=Candidatus Kentrum sp. UNK TaxID=2126344 RepID=A0A451AV05_9GAMM|nr:MAG: hypothetical protein BECKUNK1418G_GA0071005_101212 [Candidatus Kentron sp. UNK]VFK69876.1 MAG: hypothetical protein BECKUNK1418H_GA0071006_102030 [Candidatus Kentron sp. UNK]
MFFRNFKVKLALGKTSSVCEAEREISKLFDGAVGPRFSFGCYILRTLRDPSLARQSNDVSLCHEILHFVQKSHLSRRVTKIRRDLFYGYST